MQLARNSGFDNFEADLYAYFESHMAKNIVSLQGGKEDVRVGPVQPPSSSPVTTLDEMALEIVNCCTGLGLHQVRNRASLIKKWDDNYIL